MSIQDIVILSAKRTAIGTLTGSLSALALQNWAQLPLKPALKAPAFRKAKLMKC